MKIKDNLNLNGYILQNFCIDNYDSLDGINDKGTGRAVFLTGNSSNAGYGHVNVYDGTKFRALAYLDDVANNEEFLAVKRKVDAFFDGTVDVDGVIDNLEDIQKFLNNYSDATDLATILDGKLDKSGGEISSNNVTPLKIKTSTVSNLLSFVANNVEKTVIGYYASSSRGSEFRNAVSGAYIGITDDGTPHYNGNTLLHSGNVGDYAVEQVPSSYYLDLSQNYTGQTAKVFSYFQRIGTETDMSGNIGSARKGVIRISGGGSESQLLFDHYNGDLYYRNYKTAWSDWKTIAFTDSTVDKAKALVDASGNIVANYEGSTLYLGTTSPSFNTYLLGKEIRVRAGDNSATAMLINSSGNVTIGAQDLAGNDHRLYVSGHSGFVGNLDIYGGGKIQTYSNPLVINAAGNNVLIGATEDYSSGKLQIAGGVTLNGYMSNNSVSKVADLGEKGLVVGASVKRDGNWGMAFWTESNGKGCIQQQLFSDTATTYPLCLQPFGGNVLIGTTIDNGAKLQVSGDVQTNHIKSLSGLDITAHSEGEGSRLFLTTNTFRPWGSDNGKIDLGSPDIRWRTLYAEGAYIAQGAIIEGDLHVTGNIIADGEVSAGGAGEEGSGSSSGGGGAFYSETFSAGISVKTITHGLGTEDIVVSIYEKNPTSGKWDMVLTDIEIEDANTIELTFGSATDVEHKVVIMGAVA